MTAAEFVYHERTDQQWERRITQSLRSSFRVAVEPDPGDAEPEDGDESGAGESPKSKSVTAASLCTCGHRHDLHNLTLPTPPLKPTPAIGEYALIATPCEARIWDGQEWKPCPCWNYCDAVTQRPAALKRPKAEDWTLCARCGKRKDRHCVKGRAGFRIGDTPYICSHFDRNLNPVSYVCTNGHCAVVDETGNFVDCNRFVNPFLTPKARNTSTAKPRAPHKSRKKKTAFVTGTGELFSPPSGAEVPAPER